MSNFEREKEFQRQMAHLSCKKCWSEAYNIKFDHFDQYRFFDPNSMISNMIGCDDCLIEIKRWREENVLNKKDPKKEQE